jgi:hypothetical protein
MNAYAPLVGVLGRIANATGALRVRSYDIARAEANGGSSEELRDRVEALIGRLEKVASELEDALA